MHDRYAWTESITVPAGDDRITLLVMIASGTSQTPVVTSAKFGGVAMDLLFDSGAWGPGATWRTLVYYQLMPPTGLQTCDIQFDYDYDYGSCDQAATIYILGDVNQFTPFGTVAEGGAASLSGIASGIEDLIVDICGSSLDADPSGAGGGQTDQYSVFIAQYYGNMATSYKAAGSTSETMSWSSGFGGTIKHAGFAVKTAGGGGGGMLDLADW